MSRKPAFGVIQGPQFHSQGEPYEQLQQAILDQTGVVCSVLVKPHQISIMANSYSDFILARSVVSKRSGLPVIQG